MSSRVYVQIRERAPLHDHARACIIRAATAENRKREKIEARTKGRNRERERKRVIEEQEREGGGGGGYEVVVVVFLRGPRGIGERVHVVHRNAVTFILPFPAPSDARIF